MSKQESKQSLRFPFGEHHRDSIHARSGKKLDQVTLSSVIKGDVGVEDLRARRDTLEAQADVAAEAGYPQVADNLRRAAEMTAIPSEEIFEIYEALRPGRSTYYQLLSMSQRVASQYEAELTGAYIREAADSYRDTGLLKMDETGLES